MPTVQAVIVGQGLAGTALAWSLRLRGIDFVILDRGSPDTSSHIAAGLVTPVTGKRAVKSWGWDAAWRIAEQFYPEVERRTQARFWSVQPSLRLYDSEIERQALETRLSQQACELITPFDADDPSLEALPFDHSQGGFFMQPAARLEASTYLNVSRRAFQEFDAYRQHSLDLQNEIEFDAATIRIRSLDIHTHQMIFCQGAAPALTSEQNAWFSKLPLVPAQGDILTLAIPHLAESRTIHRGIWLTPFGNPDTTPPATRYRVGSTYRWTALDGRPSLAGRDEILSKLRRWMNLPFEVVDHRSAVRPSSFDQRPLLGQSAIDSRLWIFNGLGAKGTLLAPWCALHLVDCLLANSTIDQALRWDRRQSKSRS